MAKPRLDSQFIVDELTAISNGLGKLDENDGTYMKDRECKACLREILRYLNVDTDEHVARALLGELNIISSDLVPLIVQYCDFNEGDHELFQTILRLCSNLTTDPKVLFENQDIPTELEPLKVYNKLKRCLYGYKEAFASNDKVWPVLNVHLRHNTDDEITFERLIILIRNILLIPVNSSGDAGALDYFDTHDLCIYQMEKSGVLNTILKIASENEKGAEFCFHIMEIIYLTLRNQNPETLALARPVGQKRSRDEMDLEKKRYLELRARRERPVVSQSRFAPCRFRNTAFVAQNCLSISDGPMIVSKPFLPDMKINYDAGKTQLRKAKNRKPLSSETSMMTSDKNLRLSKISFSLKIFCKQFVEKVYSTYMQQIKHNLIQKKALEDDEAVYLWALQFFIAFNRHMHMNIDNISESLSTSTLHYVQILTTAYQDKLKIEKKKFLDVSRRLHLAVRAYREVLYLIRDVDSSSDSQYASVVESIKKNLYSELEYSTLLVNLFQQYEEPKHSRHYLADLVLTNDVFLELIESKLGADFITRYCNPDILKAYSGFLKTFQTNEDPVNLAVIRFFERVHECQRDTMLFQASVFKRFIEIIELKPSLPGQDRLTSLALKIFASFGAKANKKRWMFEELLFWKNYNDTIEIENAVDPPPAPQPEEKPEGETNVSQERDFVFEADEDPASANNELDFLSDHGENAAPTKERLNPPSDNNESSTGINGELDFLPGDDDDDDGDDGDDNDDHNGGGNNLDGSNEQPQQSAGKASSPSSLVSPPPASPVPSLSSSLSSSSSSLASFSLMDKTSVDADDRDFPSLPKLPTRLESDSESEPEPEPEPELGPEPIQPEPDPELELELEQENKQEQEPEPGPDCQT